MHNLQKTEQAILKNVFFSFQYFKLFLLSKSLKQVTNSH